VAAVVADASVFIALVQIDKLPLLETLFGGVIIPRAVAREVAPSLPSLPAWVERRVIERPLPPRIVAASLEAGEAEAIALALEIGAERIVLDDLPARQLAQAMGLAIVGTAGVLFMAKQHGLIQAVRPPLDALRAAGFRLRQDVYEEILKAAAESGGG
jgi:predicted nucleic acid-binding protein